MEAAVPVAVSIGVSILGLTGYGIYMGFGPPSNKLDDPFDDHED
uniref:Photosystem II PsbN subunit n=1 Tax=Paulinella micropora TaxID=1928728 RepID=A0A2Z6ERX8_9EUKA|nr:photosystem II PsbN subunit [Paulinella micropora]